MKISTACQPGEVLRRYAAGQLSENEAASVIQHLDECRTCLSQLDGIDQQPDSLMAALRQQRGVERLGGSSSNWKSLKFQPEETPGTVLNGYRIMELLGRGGMGRVYRAVHPRLDHEVALKVLRPGMLAAPLLARFDAERQVLTLMDHPNIARVLDGGAAEDGRPYLVMELVRGITITQYCDEHCLDLTERLSLFLQVCHAVQHAHQKGIIHRDIKPSNVLVTEYDDKPVPKVIDFGVAKVLNDTSLMSETQEGMLVGTPEYMSPEQASLSTADIDTRSDIYALGVLLYELLTGETPFRNLVKRDTPLLEVLRVIREEDPLAPSSRIGSAETLAEVAAHRATEVGRLARHLRGELDWIVLKCLEKNPSNRYATATALADDVQRYLENEPVTAGRPGLGYRIRKYVRRHRVWVLAGSMIFLALVAGIIGTSLGMFHASKERDQAQLERDEKKIALGKLTIEQERTQKALKAETVARKQVMVVLRSLTERVMERQITQQPTITAEDRRFFKKIIADYETFAELRGDDEESRAIRAEGHLRVGLLRAKLGEHQEAMASYEQGKTLLLSLVHDVPQSMEYHQLLATAYDVQAHLLDRLGKYPESEAEYQQAIAVWKQLLKDQPRSVAIHRDMADTYLGLGNLYGRMGRHDECLREYQQALVLNKKVLASAPLEADYRNRLANLHNNMGLMYSRIKDFKQANLEFDQAALLYATVIQDNPNVPSYSVSLAYLYDNRGKLYKDQRQFAESEASHRKALSIRKKLAAEYPTIPTMRQDLAQSHCNLGVTLQDQNKQKEAEAEYQLAYNLDKKLVADFPKVPEYAVGLGGSCCNLGNLKYLQAEVEQSLTWFDQAIEALSTLHAKGTGGVNGRIFLHNSYYARARSLMDLKQYERSLKDWNKAVELDPTSVPARIRRTLCLAYVDPKAAAAESERIAQAYNSNNGMLCEVVRILSLSSNHAQDPKLHEEYAVRAVSTLQRLANNGFLKRSAGYKFLSTDPALASLRERDDFRKLVSEVEAARR